MLENKLKNCDVSKCQFAKKIKQQNIKVEIIETKEPTTTAQQAADIHGVPVSNIVKSLVVKVGKNFKVFLVPGDKRLDFDQLKVQFDSEKVRMATPDEVKEITGYSIGGVPPFGHKRKLDTYIVEGFNKNKVLLAAAGSGNAIFKIGYEELREIVNG
jgi:Cys-tRNA(Pro) deacylase